MSSLPVQFVMIPTMTTKSKAAQPPWAMVKGNCSIPVPAIVQRSWKRVALVVASWPGMPAFMEALAGLLAGSRSGALMSGRLSMLLMVVGGVGVDQGFWSAVRCGKCYLRSVKGRGRKIYVRGRLKKVCVKICNERLRCLLRIVCREMVEDLDRE